MEQSENRFFKYIWRFNALVIAGAAVVCMMVGVYFIAQIFKEETRERHVTNVVNVGENAEVNEDFVFGYPDTMVGTDYVKIPLYRDQPYDMQYYSKSSEWNEVNYLFLNASNNESKWLLDGTNQLFISDISLSDKLEDRPTETNKTVGFVYELVEDDSDDDGRLTNRDAITISTSNTNGTQYKKLIEGIDRLYSVRQIADDKLLVLYQKNKETVSELYSVPSMKQISQQKIPQVNLK
jgi:hypothetical protein